MKLTPVGCPSFLIAALLAVASPLQATTPPRPWPEKPFEPVTFARVATQPATEQAAWKAYLEASAERGRLLSPRTASEFSPLKPLPGLPKGGAHTTGLQLNKPASWYQTAAARTTADRIVAAQSPVGAWTKGNDYTKETSSIHDSGDIWSSGTFDNEATIRELQFLARVITSANNPERAAAWQAAFVRGLEYCFAAQYPNGGFPQIYPLAGGYHDAITFNDDAMANILGLLRDAASGAGDYQFVPAATRAEAADRFSRGIACILATQLKSPTGGLTGWCQQYDALTLSPCAARNFEPTATCANESSRLLEVLMSLPRPSPAVVAAVESGIAWLNQTALHDVKWARDQTTGSGLVAAPKASRLWARFYEIGTNTPIFGERDRTIHYAVTELSTERRLGYAWYGTWPEAALEKYNAWHERLAAR